MEGEGEEAGLWCTDVVCLSDSVSGLVDLDGDYAEVEGAGGNTYSWDMLSP